MKLWVNDNEFGEDFQVDVPVSQLVAALQEEGVGEVVEATADDQAYDEWALVPLRWPGRYLVVRIDGETPWSASTETP